jgi:DNA-binding CsgD family transcriptional regulator
MERVERFIAGLEACATTEEIVVLFSAAIREIGYHGFDAYSFAVDTFNNVGQPGNFAVCDYDRQVITDYVRKGWMQMCPTIEETARGKVPYDYVAFLDRSPPNGSVRWQKFMLKLFGVRHAWLVPLSSISVNKGVTVYMRGKGPDSEDLFHSTRHEIHLLASYLMDALDGAQGAQPRLLTSVAANGEAAPEITPREIDCLHWAARGKSNREIGEILGISENTVHFHLKNVYRKLDVSSRSQAVSEALRAGLISG